MHYPIYSAIICVYYKILFFLILFVAIFFVKLVNFFTKSPLRNIGNNFNQTVATVIVVSTMKNRDTVIPNGVASQIL